MKITCDAEGNVVTVARDDQPIGTGAIAIPDNEELIVNPSRFRYSGGAVELKPYFDLVSDAPDANGDGIPSVVSGGTHNITITARNASGAVDPSLNGPASLAVLDAYTQYDTKALVFSSGVASVSLSYNRAFLPMLSMSVPGYCPFFGGIEFTAA